jgi:nucleotide-binding universal stress UspA family protein
LEDQPHFAGEKYERIACAVDLTDLSEHTLRFAVDFAKAWEATLTVIHASNWVVGADADKGMLSESRRKTLLDTAKGEALALLRAVGCDADLRVGFGRPEDFVPEIAREVGADMLIVGRRTGQDGGGLGPHGHDLIRSSPCPVLSV